MILTIKATSCEQLPDGSLRIIADVEDFKEALSQHSPNILIDYLNERWKPGIANVKYNKRKEAPYDNTNNR